MTSSTADEPPVDARPADAPDPPDRHIVVDSNVWISALVFGGGPRRVFERIVRDGKRLVVSEAIHVEVRRIVGAKFPGFESDVDALRTVMAPFTNVVALGAATVDVCRDPDDNRVLETAMLGRASGIVTGDHDLLVLGTYERIRIVTPASWLAGPSRR